MYGTIRMHQERMYPGRVIATALRNPDFAAYARAFGGHGETVEETAEFLPAYERALASGLPSILHVKVDPDAITPTTTLSAIRAQALEKSATRSSSTLLPRARDSGRTRWRATCRGRPRLMDHRSRRRG